MTNKHIPPILSDKHPAETPVFRPENLLWEGRRQRDLPKGEVPEICFLDPDGDIARWLIAQKQAKRSPYWACYHTELYMFELDGRQVGVIGNTVALLASVVNAVR